MIRRLAVSTRNGLVQSVPQNILGCGNLLCAVVEEPPVGPPVNLTLPEITGGEPLQCGETLTVSTGTWSGAEPITFTYKGFEFIDGTPIEVAIGSTYIAEHGGTYFVEVTASNADGSATVTSAEAQVTCD